MKKYILRIFLFFVISIVSFSANYSIKNLDVRAVLRKDGSMLVNEAVTYKIGDINGVYFDIDAKGYGGVKSLKVFENDTRDLKDDMVIKDEITKSAITIMDINGRQETIENFPDANIVRLEIMQIQSMRERELERLKSQNNQN